MNRYPIVITGPKRPSDVIRVDGETWIRSTNENYYLADALRDAAPLFEGAPFHLRHAKMQWGRNREGRKVLRVTKSRRTLAHTGIETFDARAYESMRLGKHDRIGQIEGAYWLPATWEIRGELAVTDPIWADVLGDLRESGELWTWAISPVWTAGRRAQRGLRRYYVELTATRGADLVSKGGTGGRFLKTGGGLQ